MSGTLVDIDIEANKDTSVYKSDINEDDQENYNKHNEQLKDLNVKVDEIIKLVDELLKNFNTCDTTFDKIFTKITKIKELVDKLLENCNKHDEKFLDMTFDKIVPKIKELVDKLLENFNIHDEEIL